MTISTTSTRKAGPFDGNDTATSFPFTFKVFTEDDVAVTLTDADGVESALVLDSDYSVTLNADQDADPGGEITYPLSGVPLATGEKLTITGALDELQPTTLTNGGGFFPKVIERALDRVVIYAQQLREAVDRSIKLPVSDDSSINVELPVASLRARKALIFGADGGVAISTDDYEDQAANAAASAAAAAASWELLDDRYLGGKAADPLVDNDGDALVEGQLYWNTTAKEFRVYNGSTWQMVVPAGNLQKETYVAGVDFTPGTTTVLPLPVDPLVKENLDIVFDAAWQQMTEFELSHIPLQVEFNDPIPLGVQQIEISYTVPLQINEPADGTVTDAKLSSTSSVLDAIVNKLKFIDAGTGAVYRSLRDKLRDMPSVMDYGAKGDGVTDDTAAIQAAIDANSVIYFPRPSSYYKVNGSLKIGGTTGTGNKTLVGPHNGLAIDTPAIIRGQGAAALFKTGTYPAGDSSKNREISITGLSASNANYPVLELLTAINFEVDRCSFSSLTNSDAAVKVRMSYRGRITNSFVSCSGGGYAITAYDNCNGVRINDNILTGGSAGGAVHIEQSQGVSFNHNIIESSKYGVVVASGIDPATATAVVGAGNVNGFECINNYLEVVDYPFMLAYGDGTTARPGQSIYGASIKDNYVGNASVSLDGYVFYIGRLNGSEISNNSFYRKTGGAVAACYFSYATGASTPWAQNTRIVNNMVFNGTGAFLNYDNTVAGGPTYPGLIGALYGDNEIQTQATWSSSGSAVSSAPSGLRVYVSDKITANVGLAQTAFDTTLTGGVVHSVEVIDATGSLGCTVYLGSSVSVGEIWGSSGFDPSTLSYTLGGAKALIGAGGSKYIRAGVPPALRVVAGAGTGTFRIRIKYHAA